MDFVPENSLERALVAFATQPGARIEFDRLLLLSPLHVIGEDGNGNGGAEQEKLVEGAQVRLVAIRRGDAQYIPAFTSPARLQIFFEPLSLFSPEGIAFALMGGKAHDVAVDNREVRRAPVERVIGLLLIEKLTEVGSVVLVVPQCRKEGRLAKQFTLDVEKTSP